MLLSAASCAPLYEDMSPEGIRARIAAGTTGSARVVQRKNEALSPAVARRTHEMDDEELVAQWRADRLDSDGELGTPEQPDLVTPPRLSPTPPEGEPRKKRTPFVPRVASLAKPSPPRRRGPSPPRSADLTPTSDITEHESGARRRTAPIIRRNMDNIREIEAMMLCQPKRRLEHRTSPPRSDVSPGAAGISIAVSAAQGAAAAAGGQGQRVPGAARNSMSATSAGSLQTPASEALPAWRHLAATPASDSNAQSATQSAGELSRAEVVRQRRKELLNQKRDKAATELVRRDQQHEEASRIAAGLDDFVQRLGAWMLVVKLVCSFDTMDSQSTAIIRKERERKRRWAMQVMAKRLPGLWQMHQRRMRVKRFRRAAVQVLAVVRFRRLRLVAAARTLRIVMRKVSTDRSVMFRHFTRTLYKVKRMLLRRAHGRHGLQDLLLEQWRAMEVYLLVTRPSLVFATNELKSIPGVRLLTPDAVSHVKDCRIRFPDKLDGSMSKSRKSSPAGSPLRRPNRFFRAAYFVADSLPSDAPIGDGVEDIYTLVPTELLQDAYGKWVPYFEFVNKWRKYCLETGADPNLGDFDVLRSIAALRNRELRDYRAAHWRAVNRRMRTDLDHFFNERRAAVDMLEAAMMTRREEAKKRVKLRQPTVLTTSAVFTALVELDAQGTAPTPLIQALIKGCKDTLHAKLPPVEPRRRMVPAGQLEDLVAKTLRHSKLVRLLKVTATDVPPGFET